MKLLSKTREELTMESIITMMKIPEAPTKWERFKKFCKDVVIAAKNSIVNFFKGIYHHFESVTVLTLSSFGLSALLGEIPFWVALPWWIEAAMVIPLISVTIITLLVLNGERRAKGRMAHA